MPGLDAALLAIPLSVLEGRENPSIKLLKEFRGPALLIPKEYGGLGATAAEGLAVLRAVASRALRLGIAYTMHNFSVATLVAWAVFGGVWAIHSEQPGRALDVSGVRFRRRASGPKHLT